MSTLAESLVAICKWIGDWVASLCGMQIVTEGSAFPGLQLCALNFSLKTKGRQNIRKRSKRVNIGPPRQSLCCMYMDARDKAEFAAEGVFFNLGQIKNQERLFGYTPYVLGTGLTTICSSL